MQRLGDFITPSGLLILNRAPKLMITVIFWTLRWLKAICDLGALEPLEPRALIDAMIVAAPDHSSALRAIRP